MYKRQLKDIKAEKLTAYVDKVSDEPLMAEAPKGGKIVSEQTDDTFGTTTLTLSKGVKVIIKKTDFKANEIRMKGVSLGGSSLDVYKRQDVFLYLLKFGLNRCIMCRVGDFDHGAMLPCLFLLSLIHISNSVMRGRVNAIRTFKGLVADLRSIKHPHIATSF